MPRVLLLAIARILLAGAACLAFAGCSSLPGIGPSAGDVVEEAGAGAAQRYELVDINSNVIAILRQRGPNSFLAHFGDYRPSVEPRIGVGDTVSVTIWEAGAGGLFSAPLVADRFTT
ncbi:MAG: polysaccharide biosynthesis/export family protein, partial [Methylocella sp.]